MLKFQKILVPVDIAAESDPALDRAAELAKSSGAAITLIDVVEEVPRYVDVLQLQDAVLQVRKKNLEAIADPLRKDGLNVSTSVVEGAPAWEVVREVLRNGHDLILRTSRVEGFVQRLFVGTLAMRLMRLSPVPVWVVQPRHASPFNRILVAVDPVPLDEKENELNLKILSLAQAISEMENAELHVVHAWQVYDERTLERWAFTFDVSNYISMASAEAEQLLKELIEKSGISLPSRQIHFVKGPAAEVIPGMVEKTDSELLVMGSVARSGLSGFLIGNTAERILHQVDCSLLTLKPDDFSCPVDPGD